MLNYFALTGGPALFVVQGNLRFGRCQGLEGRRRQFLPELGSDSRLSARSFTMRLRADACYVFRQLVGSASQLRTFSQRQLRPEAVWKRC